MSKKSKRRRQSGFPGLYSGQILGAVVKALDLDEGFLTEKTADRFFATGNASEYSRKTVFQELGQVLVDLELVPDVASKLPEGGKTADALAGGVSLMCNRWDLLMDWIQGRSATVSDVGGAGQKFLRLATVDVALRMLGFAHLAELELPEPYVPVWAQPNGAGEILRGHQNELGLRRHQLARRLEVSPTTVDNWLDGNNLPGRAHLPVLARELSRGRPISAEDLEMQLRRQFALARLAETAASVVGWEAVGADVEAVFWFAKFMHESDALTRLPDEHGDVAALVLVLLGSMAPFAPLLLWPLAERLQYYEWSDEIYAVASSLEVQFEFIADSHSGGRTAAGLAQDYFDVVFEPSPGDLAAAGAIARVLRGQMEEVLPLKPVMDAKAHPLTFFERAIQVRRDLVRRYSGNAEAHYQLGSMLGLVGRRLGKRALVNEGIMECRVAVGLEPRWDAPAVEPGIILVNLEDWDGALRELKAAEESLPAVTPHLRYIRGYALMNSGRFDEALVEYLVVVKTRPDFASAWGYAAHCAFSLGNNTEGLRFAKKARALGDPATYDAWDRGAYGSRRKGRSNG